MKLWSRLDAMYSKRLHDVREEPFDYIVIGGGAYGICFARRILDLDPGCRVLLLDKGDFLIPEHFQNLPPAYLALMDRPDCFDQPWETVTQYNIHLEVPYLGGRTLFWNAWVPQPDPSQLNDWPEEVVQDLKRYWYEVGELMGRRDAIAIGDYYGDLHLDARERLFAGLKDIPLAMPCSRPGDLEGAMATHEPESRQGWRRFAPLSLLVADLNDRPDQMILVADCPVERLLHENGRVTRLVTAQGELDVRSARVLLAAAVIPSATVALASFPDHPLIGNNLIGHLRSQVVVRVPREAFTTSPDLVEVAALYMDGMDYGRQFHVHVTMASNPDPERQYDDLYLVTPDPTTFQWCQDPRYVTLILQGLGELTGERRAGARNRVFLKDGKTLVDIHIDAADRKFWSAMDETLYQVAGVLAGGHPAEYLQKDQTTWGPGRYVLQDDMLVHEAGVLWMGRDPATSVTDLYGRFHGVENLYSVTGAVFPTCGSYNQTFTGVALAFRLARHLADQKNG